MKPTTDGISGVIITRAKRMPELLSLIACLKSITDETVIILDNPDSKAAEKLGNHADIVCALPGKGQRLFGAQSYYEDIFNNCNCSWILRIDDDETLDDAWTYETLHQLICDKNATQYYFPTKWMINSEEYIVSKPWFPDNHNRLFRNLPSIIHFPKKPHESPVIPGEMRFNNDLYITHWDLAISDRAYRESKVQFYKKHNPENPCSQYYLYEDYDIETLKHSTFVSDTKYPPPRQLTRTLKSLYQILDPLTMC